MNLKLTNKQICMISIAILINLIGGQIALLLKLPIYLDQIGTIFIATIYGPFISILPSFISPIILGITGDPFAIYYIPVGILIGVLSGIFLKNNHLSITQMISRTLLITLPSTFIAALITSYLFGGITSSGSTYLVQLLSKTPLGLTVSCFIVQFLTDYFDRFISIYLIQVLLKKIPNNES